MLTRPDGPGRARAEFVRRVGREPVGLWAAPGRVNLIGEHTDYNDGFVLPLAIDRGVTVAAGPGDGGSRVWSRQQDGTGAFRGARVRPGDVHGWAAYVAGVCWALHRAGHAVPEVDVMVDGDVPLGAGLSSSAALGCAVAYALTDLAQVRLRPTELALLVQRAENEFVGVPCGAMDQLASMHGRPGHLVHVDCRSLDVEHVPFDPAAHGLVLLVADTRAPRALADGRYAQRRAECVAAAAELGIGTLRDATAAGLEDLEPALRARARHVVGENERVRQVVAALRSGADPREIGPLLTASHESLRDDFAVTVPHLDVAVDAALAAGAYGARMTGGGFGGCVIALVELGGARAVVDGIEEAFAARGFGAPVGFEAVPAAGARRIR